MTPDSKLKQAIWQQHINDWRQSQLTQKDFCARNELSYANFSYWRTRINRLDNHNNKFIPVTVGQPQAVMNVFLPGGLRQEVPSRTLTGILPVIYRIIQ